MTRSFFSHQPDSDDVKELTTAVVLRKFLHGMTFYPPNITSTNKDLEAKMRTEMNERNIGCPQLEKTLHLAASLIELGYHGCTLAEKTTIALYNWYLIYIDDMSSRDVGPFAVFEQRLLRGLPQLNAVLDALADVLFRMCDQYETPTANSILTATFEFVNSTCIEPDIETLPLVRGCTRFPWFLRDRTGVAIAFALMLFPKSKRIGVTDYIQALPDMNFWISVTNDLLSFHKEDIAGEKANYVYNRSYVEEQAPLTIIAKMEKELQMSRKTIYTALKHCPHAIDVWCMWELGYVEWHLAQQRYKLRDLGL